MMDLAHFPLSGPMLNPTADDYLAEAKRLREVGAALVHRDKWVTGHKRVSSHSQRYYELARRFEKTAVRLSWVPPRRDEAERKSA